MREERGWSQWELASRAGVSINYAGLLERGEVDPGLSKIAGVARVFGLSASELLALAESSGPRRSKS